MKLVRPEIAATICIWCEAQGEPFEGKVAVGEVLRARMRRKYSSDGTVAGTVARRYQFSFMNDDRQNNNLLIRALDLNEDDPVVRECMRAWFVSEKSNYVKGAVLYLNEALVKPLPNWADPAKRVGRIGDHTFYLD